jgi:mannose-6-phosphate isomerase-like protein (cupin superfamily)
MGIIRFSDDHGTEWSEVRDLVSPERGQTFSSAELESLVRIHHAGDDDEPQLFEVRHPPNTDLEPHAHSEDEIIFVIEGDLRVGRRTVGPGSAVLIGSDTLYRLRVGASGVRYLNFRSRAASYLTADDIAHPQ